MPTLSVKKLSVRITLAVMVILTTCIGTFALLASLWATRTAKHHAEESCRDWASAIGYGIQALVDASGKEDARPIAEFLERQRGHNAMAGLQAFDGHLREMFPSQRFPVLNSVHSAALLTAVEAGRDTSYYEPDGVLLNHIQPVWTLGLAGTTGGTMWGAIRVTMSMADEWSRIRRTTFILLSGELIAVAVTGLLLSRWLRKVVVRPIEQTELTLTALAQGDMKARVTWTSDDELGSLARHVNRMADALAHQRELEVKLVHLSKLSDILAEDLPMIEGVYSDFSQCFTNLIRNALDAMHNSKKKELTFETGQEGDDLIVRIGDTGSGIPKAHLDRIFDPFFTTKPIAEEAKPGEPTGTGLGLSTCVQLLKPYGAEIVAASEVGVGTTFTVRIPMRAESDAA